MIVTVTMNPAIDKSTSPEILVPEKSCLVKPGRDKDIVDCFALNLLRFRKLENLSLLQLEKNWY